MKPEDSPMTDGTGPVGEPGLQRTATRAGVLVRLVFASSPVIRTSGGFRPPFGGVCLPILVLE